MSIWDEEPDFTPSQNVVELRTIEDAVKILDEWEQAYKEASTAWARQHDAYCKMKFRAECAESLAANYELLYERVLADDEAREALRGV